MAILSYMMWGYYPVYAKSLDLAAVAAWVGLAMLSILIGLSNTPSRLLLTIPLVIFLPGYALVAALFPRSTLAIAERLTFSLGISIVLTIMGGFLLNLTSWGIQAESWTLLLAGLTLTATALAFMRRRFGTGTGAAGLSVGRVKLLMRPRDVLFFGIAAFVTLSALVVARQGVIEQDNTDFTQFWILPLQDNSVRLGFNNEEKATVTYRLQLQADNRVIHEWPGIVLASGQKWETVYDLPNKTEPLKNQAIVALLFRSDMPNVVYRRVALQPSN